ncbi:MAG TPA: DUF1045 domain-containing protein, partial [Acetobacteraceae bacterium]|nr:DUF1045 domain-containing protein [Acetobacteraceae bacterium]
MRYALYWAPPPDDPLWQQGCAWLGRDAATGAHVPQPDIPNIAALTEDARHYGLHCTLRAPMRLATDEHKLASSIRKIAETMHSFALPPLTLRSVDGFLSLTLTASCPEMRTLADQCVRETDHHRLPASPKELARRRATGLKPRQETMLRRWGYPYVMDDWLFHITLTRRLSSSELAEILPEAQSWFAPLLNLPRLVDGICIFVQCEGDFVITERIGFG